MAKTGVNQQNGLLETLRNSIISEGHAAEESLGLLMNKKAGTLPEQQSRAMESIQAALQHLTAVAEKPSLPSMPH